MSTNLNINQCYDYSKRKSYLLKLSTHIHNITSWSISQKHAHDAYILRLPCTTVSGSEKITFKMWIFSLQKTMNSLQEAFIHPWSRVRDILLRIRARYFMSSELLTTNNRLPPLQGLEGPGPFWITWLNSSERRKSHTPRMHWGWVKHRLISGK